MSDTNQDAKVMQLAATLPEVQPELLDVAKQAVAELDAAVRAGIPPRLLYGVALQESAMLWGEKVLPWLWTLNVRGTPHRYATYDDGVRALTNWVTVQKVRNVDCGPMQINWRWHGVWPSPASPRQSSARARWTSWRIRSAR